MKISKDILFKCFVNRIHAHSFCNSEASLQPPSRAQGPGVLPQTNQWLDLKSDPRRSHFSLLEVSKRGAQWGGTTSKAGREEHAGS